MSKNYLRDRPFLVASFSRRPKKDANTRIKGWQNDKNNMETFEHVSIVDRINNKELQASVIIDIVESKMIKNTTGSTDDSINEHFIGKYADKIKHALSIWAQQQVVKRLKEAQDGIAILDTPVDESAE